MTDRPLIPAWQRLEQASIWIKKAMVESDSNGRPCSHCVREAMDWLESLSLDDPRTVPA